MTLRTALIADDDPLIVALLEEVLADEGFAVAGVSGGQAALERVLSQPPDVLLLDVRMTPDLSGWDVLRRLQSMERLVPTIVLTADGASTATALPLAQRLDALGAGLVMGKPFDIDCLLAAVNRLAPPSPRPER